ncbi:MAG TPA: hypothetical protein VF401_03300 [Candidatus Saccharimonadales bacterium]
MSSHKTPKRIGIYAGTFNPVHAGHVAFALQALKAGKLDALFFMPERQPRGKPGVEHFGHRVAMLRRASKPHSRFGVLEMPDVNFSVGRTIPRLKKQFPNSELVFLFGSDVVPSIHAWQNADQLLENYEIIAGLRGNDTEQTLKALTASWPQKIHFVHSYAPAVSSHKIREALRRRQYDAQGLLASVRRYSDRHWLYVSLA